MHIQNTLKIPILQRQKASKKSKPLTFCSREQKVRKYDFRYQGKVRQFWRMLFCGNDMGQ